MTAQRFKPYAAYKESGVEWLRAVPAHWDAARMWRICRAMSGATPSREEGRYWDGNIPWVSPKDMKRRIIDSSEDTVTEQAIEDTALRIIQPPVVLIVVRGMILAHSFPVALTSVPVTINQDMKALVFQCGINLPFVRWLLEGVGGSLVSAIVEEAAHGTRAVRMDQWRSVTLPLPPDAEQRAIAAFLDRETARIDALMAKKERLIELLQEKRAALITRAVTKGLDLGVPMKDSGIEWLGTVPSRWRIAKLKAVSLLQTGLTLGKNYEPSALEARPYLRVANVQDGRLDLSDVATVELPHSHAARYELRAGDVLMTEGGDFDKLGRGHVWEGQIAGCLHQNHIFAVRPTPTELQPRFLAAVMGSGYGRAFFTATSKQSTNLASTNGTTLKNCPIPLPRREEQDQILSFIAAESDRWTGSSRRFLRRSTGSRSCGPRSSPLR